jgi:hypothetical protein
LPAWQTSLKFKDDLIIDFNENKHISVAREAKIVAMQPVT